LANWAVVLSLGLGDPSLAFRAPWAVCCAGLPKPLSPWRLGEIGFIPQFCFYGLSFGGLRLSRYARQRADSRYLDATAGNRVPDYSEAPPPAACRVVFDYRLPAGSKSSGSAASAWRGQATLPSSLSSPDGRIRLFSRYCGAVPDLNGRPRRPKPPRVDWWPARFGRRLRRFARVGIGGRIWLSAPRVVLISTRSSMFAQHVGCGPECAVSTQSIRQDHQ
jgi:hypothetical protein